MSLTSISMFVIIEIPRDVTNAPTILQSYFPNVRTNGCDLIIQGLNVRFNRLSTVPSADPGTKLARKMEE